MTYCTQHLVHSRVFVGECVVLVVCVVSELLCVLNLFQIVCLLNVILVWSVVTFLYGRNVVFWSFLFSSELCKLGGFLAAMMICSCM